MENINSKNKILNTVVDLLNNKSIDKITIREIARLAQVNTASINYYFSSKEALFNEALDLNISKGINEWVENHINFNTTKKNDLIDFLFFLHQAVIQNPGFGKTRILSLLNSKEVNSTNLKICETILEIAKKTEIEPDENRLKIKVSLAFASLTNFSCSINEMDKFLGIQIKNEEELKKYMESITHLIFQ